MRINAFRSYRSTCAQSMRGITALESAIIMPFFLMLVYGVIYLALYLSVQGILDTAATRALTIATTGQSFEIAESDGPPDCSNQQNQASSFCVAQEELKQEILTTAAAAWVRPDAQSGGIAYLDANVPTNPNIEWPVASASRSYQQVLQNSPITVSVQAHIRTFIPFFPTLTVVGRAAGFRELRKSLSYPVQTDCNGYPVGHSLYKQRPCVCTTPNSAWNPTLQACEVCDDGRAVPTVNPTSGAMSGPPGFFIITPVPSWGRPPQFCACPDSSTCLTRHGGNALTFMNACRCGCQLANGQNVLLESDPEQNYFEQCNPCSGVPPPANPASGVNVPPITFSGYTSSVGGGGRVVCQCVKSSGGGPLTTADCQMLFGPRGSQVVADPTGCKCICAGTYCGADGQASATPRPNATPGPGQGNLWWWNPYSGFGCGCFCGNSNNGQADPERSMNPSTGGCDCNQPCPGVQVRGQNDACTADTCHCPSSGGPVSCPPGSIISDADPSCTTCVPTSGGGNG